MSIPVDDQALLRTTGMQWLRPTLNLWPVEEIASATITATPSEYPIGSVSVGSTSGWTDVRVGQLYIIRDDDSNLVRYGVVRLPPTSNVLYIDGASHGDPGKAVQFAKQIESGNSVTIYSQQPLWSLLSRIVKGKFYKKYDVPYTNQGSNPPPVCNIGPWRQATVASGGTAQFAFSNASSFAWRTKTIVSYAWTVPSEAVFIVGDETSADITIELPEGFWKVYCTITDDGGASADACRPIWVNGPNYPAFSDLYPMTIDSDSQPLTGRRIGCSFRRDSYGYNVLDESLLLPGAAWHFSETAFYDDQQLTEGTLVPSFSGFLGDEMPSMNQFDASMTADIMSPMDCLAVIPMVSQAIIESASPHDWTMVSNGLGTPSFVGFYVLKHHTTYLDLFDYNPLVEDNEPRKKRWGLSGSTVADYVKAVGAIIGGNMGCDSSGAMYIRRNPSLEPDAFRDDLDQRITFGVDDLIDNPQLARKYHNKVGQLQAYAFAYTGNKVAALASIAPGFAQGQAPGQVKEESLIIYGGADAQERLNVIAGHYLAAENAQTDALALKLNRNFDIADPAWMLWYGLNIPADFYVNRVSNVTGYDVRGQGFSGRGTVTQVQRHWRQVEMGAWIKEVELTWLPETKGQAGVKLPIPDGEGSANPPLSQPKKPPVTAQVGGWVFAVNDQGVLGRSFNGRDWSSITSGLTGVVNDFAFNNFTPYPLSGYAGGNFGMWILLTSGTTVSIYYTADCLGKNVLWTLQKSWTKADSSSPTSGRILSSKTVSGLAGAAWRTRAGVYFAYTSDGSTWSVTPTKVGNSSASDAVNDDLPLGMFLRGNVIVVTGHDTVSGRAFYHPYWATLPTPTFAAVSSAEDSNEPNPLIMIDDNDVLFLTTVNWAAGGYYAVSFDGAGTDYTNWTYSISGGTDNSVLSGTSEVVRLLKTSAGGVITAVVDFGRDISTRQFPPETWYFTGLFAGGGTSRTIELYDEDDNLLGSATRTAPTQPGPYLPIVEGIRYAKFISSTRAINRIAVGQFGPSILDPAAAHWLQVFPDDPIGPDDFIVVDNDLVTDGSIIETTTYNVVGGGGTGGGQINWASGSTAGAGSKITVQIEFPGYPQGIRIASGGKWFVEAAFGDHDNSTTSLRFVVEVYDTSNVLQYNLTNDFPANVGTTRNFGGESIPFDDVRNVGKIIFSIEMLGSYSPSGGFNAVLDLSFIEAQFQDEADGYEGNGKP